MRDGIGDESIWKLRLDTLKIIGAGFQFYGIRLIEVPDDDPNKGDFTAFSIILKMAGDLVSGIDKMISQISSMPVRL